MYLYLNHPSLYYLRGRQWHVGLSRPYFCSSFSPSFLSFSPSFPSFSPASLALSSQQQETLLFTGSGRAGKESLIKEFKNILVFNHKFLPGKIVHQTKFSILTKFSITNSSQGKFSPSQGQFSHQTTRMDRVRSQHMCGDQKGLCGLFMCCVKHSKIVTHKHKTGT